MIYHLKKQKFHTKSGRLHITKYFRYNDIVKILNILFCYVGRNFTIHSMMKPVYCVAETEMYSTHLQSNNIFSWKIGFEYFFNKITVRSVLKAMLTFNLNHPMLRSTNLWTRKAWYQIRIRVVAIKVDFYINSFEYNNTIEI